MTSLRRAILDLSSTLAPSAGRDAAPASVAGLSCVVMQDGKQELVSLRLHEGALALACTCGKPACSHARAALALFEADEPGTLELRELPEARRSHEWGDLPMRVSEPPAAMPPPQDGQSREGLAAALSDVLVAVARSGVAEGASAGVVEALERVGRYASSHGAAGLRIFVGTLRTALEARDPDATVRALAGASALLEALRAPASESHEARIATWLGPSSPSAHVGTGSAPGNARVSERTYLELSREQRAGLTRADVERRYLMDLSDGAFYREDRTASEPSISVGPCPRVVSVGLAHIEPGAVPRRIRLLQYTTTPMLDADVFEQAGRFAAPSFEPLLQRQQQHVRDSAEMTDLLALVRPKGLSDLEHARLTDDAGHALLLHAGEGVARRLAGFFTEAEPMWVFGRVLHHAGELALLPLAACGRNKLGRPTHLQL